jgi:plasmid stabilization system protein ParE
VIRLSAAALDDLNAITTFTLNRSGMAEASAVVTVIEAAINKVDKPMNLSRIGQIQNTRELLVSYKKKLQYLIVFEETSPGDFLVLVIKHTLQKFP